MCAIDILNTGVNTVMIRDYDTARGILSSRSYDWEGYNIFYDSPSDVPLMMERALSNRLLDEEIEFRDSFGSLFFKLSVRVFEIAQEVFESNFEAPDEFR